MGWRTAFGKPWWGAWGGEGMAASILGGSRPGRAALGEPACLGEPPWVELGFIILKEN